MRNQIITWLKRIRSDLPNIFFAVVIVVVNLVLFVSEYRHYYEATEFFYLRLLIGGHFLSLARASALCLKANSAFVLIPICRNCLLLLRSIFSHCPEPAGRSTRRLLDNNVIHHKWIGRAILLFTLLHIFAHCFNLERLCQAYDSDDQIILALSRYPDNFEIDDSSSTSSNYLNPIRSSSTSPYSVLFSSSTGFTGLIAVGALILIWTSASRTVRIYAYELFWLTHRLFVVYYIALGLHGVGGFVRHQTNVDNHNPHDCVKRISQWGERPDCPLPRFAPSPPSAWKWILGPIALYVIERFVKMFRTRHPYRITAIVFHPSNVLELRMRPSVGSRIPVEPGQYVSLQCPALSKLEWHPFTLTSAPDDEDISVHIRGVGDWTKGLAALCQMKEDEPPVSTTTTTTTSTTTSEDQRNKRDNPKIAKKPPNLLRIIQRSSQRYRTPPRTSTPLQQEQSRQQQLPPPPLSSCRRPAADKLPVAVDISAAPIVYVDGPFGAASEEWFSYETAVFVGAGIGVTPFASVLKHVANRRKAGLNHRHAYVKKIHFFWVTPEMTAFEWFRDLLHDLETSTRRLGGRTPVAAKTAAAAAKTAAAATNSMAAAKNEPSMTSSSPRFATPTSASLPSPIPQSRATPSATSFPSTAASPFTIYSQDSAASAISPASVASAASAGSAASAFASGSSGVSAAAGDDKLLSYHIFLTRGWDPKEAGEIAARDRSSTYDAFTNLHHRTEFGRPNWKAELTKIVDGLEGGARVGVFLCGPKPLAEELKEACSSVNERTENGTRLYFNKEHF